MTKSLVNKCARVHVMAAGCGKECEDKGVGGLACHYIAFFAHMHRTLLLIFRRTLVYNHCVETHNKSDIGLYFSFHQQIP